MGTEVKTFEEVLLTNGVLTYTNKGISMLPLIREGKDVMVISRADTFKKGDAVLFKRDNGQYVLHRIKKIKGDKFYIIGDNCYNGEIVSKEDILGVLTGLYRGEKFIKSNSLKYRLYVFFLPVIRWKINLHKLWQTLKKIVKKIIGKKS